MQTTTGKDMVNIITTEKTYDNGGVGPGFSLRTRAYQYNIEENIAIEKDINNTGIASKIPSELSNGDATECIYFYSKDNRTISFMNSENIYFYDLDFVFKSIQSMDVVFDQSTCDKIADGLDLTFPRNTNLSNMNFGSFSIEYGIDERADVGVGNFSISQSGISSVSKMSHSELFNMSKLLFEKTVRNKYPGEIVKEHPIRIDFYPNSVDDLISFVAMTTVDTSNTIRSRTNIVKMSSNRLSVNEILISGEVLYQYVEEKYHLVPNMSVSVYPNTGSTYTNDIFQLVVIYDFGLPTERYVYELIYIGDPICNNISLDSDLWCESYDERKNIHTSQKSIDRRWAVGMDQCFVPTVDTPFGDDIRFDFIEDVLLPPGTDESRRYGLYDYLFIDTVNLPDGSYGTIGFSLIEDLANPSGYENYLTTMTEDIGSMTYTEPVMHQGAKLSVVGSNHYEASDFMLLNSGAKYKYINKYDVRDINNHTIDFMLFYIEIEKDLSDATLDPSTHLLLSDIGITSLYDEKYMNIVCDMNNGESTVILMRSLTGTSSSDTNEIKMYAN